ncbi:hypothetical protein ALC57_16414, partial [Trachymyrmex cornetzi]
YIYSMEHRAMRLLSRRYDLTATGYKYLEIGISVGPPSYVEIALGDHCGHELSLSLETQLVECELLALVFNTQKKNRIK